MSWTWFWRSGWWTTKNVWQFQKGIFTSGLWHGAPCYHVVRLNKWSSMNWTSIELGVWPQRPFCLFLSSPSSCLPPCEQNNHKNPLTFCGNTWPGFPVIPVYTWINPKLTLMTAGYPWPCEFKYEMH
jgi:hypothetical protein